MNLSLRLYFYLLLVMSMISVTSCSENTIYQFSAEQEVSLDTISLQTVNLYLETSASMRGYVNSNVPGSYPLKEVVPFMVTDLNNAIGVMSNLYTISDKSKKYEYSNAQFFNNLRSGRIFTGKSSKLQNIFIDVISETSVGTVSILITDCIPDLGNVNNRTEGSRITSELYSHIAGNPSLGVAVFKYSSDFNGTHYFNSVNNNGVKTSKRPFYNKILKNRPFYIWVFGEKGLINKLLLENIFKTYQSAHGYNLGMQKIDAGLLKYPKSGKISINPAKNTMFIQGIEPKKPATFTVGINLNGISELHKGQFMDTLNYKIGPDYIQESIELQVKDKNTLFSEKIKDKSPIEEAGYTHFIQPTLYDFDPTTKAITFNIENTEPQWIFESSLQDDLGISQEDLEDKTFGFNFITDAFSRAFSGEELLLQLTLTKQKNNN